LHIAEDSKPERDDANEINADEGAEGVKGTVALAAVRERARGAMIARTSISTEKKR
jgi:hypothetical protein